ncbi:sporulation RMD1-like protein, putative [Actinidia rufa]|uniref:Sporulation RMD1-like protein, putative n=1 Tax=Actinidia rufa TaxID=165716 RepID=A0A7J0E184_9ERIC|nr:sporulation RMD1-like protein, putative [Actinidia rufa]
MVIATPGSGGSEIFSTLEREGEAIFLSKEMYHRTSTVVSWEASGSYRCNHHHDTSSKESGALGPLCLKNGQDGTNSRVGFTEQTLTNLNSRLQATYPPGRVLRPPLLVWTQCAELDVCTKLWACRARLAQMLGCAEGLGANISGSDCCYMVVFQYGSIVLFNVHEHDVDGYLKIVEKHASGLLPEMRKDEYEVREKPTLNTWMQGGLDYIMLQYLNIDGIRTIGSVLGQSIALDYYVRQVDGIVAEFTDINRGMEKTGTFTMERKKLFQLVGKANSNLADVILKLGLFERSDIAWKDAKYAQIWEYLRDEFELTQRFASLDFKLKFVEEILQNRKSDFLEWLIIILIGAEILISVYDIAHKSAITSL